MHLLQGAERRAQNLFRVYVRFGLTRKATAMAKTVRDLKAVLGVDPRRYLAWHPRAEVSWGCSAWEDALVSDFRRFLQELAISNPSGGKPAGASGGEPGT